jgi:hypothetical protein
LAHGQIHWRRARANPPFCTATHRPREYHVTIRSQATQFVTFNLAEPAELEAIEPYWPAVGKAATLRKGEFIAYNNGTGGPGVLERTDDAKPELFCRLKVARVIRRQGEPALNRRRRHQ